MIIINKVNKPLKDFLYIYTMNTFWKRILKESHVFVNQFKDSVRHVIEQGKQGHHKCHILVLQKKSLFHRCTVFRSCVRCILGVAQFSCPMVYPVKCHVCWNSVVSNVVAMETDLFVHVKTVDPTRLIDYEGENRIIWFWEILQCLHLTGYFVDDLL